ncbi:Senecionine N-oxygenase [Tilletia horrida]|uniref:glutaminase n=1 Tax=Tilletia horrida TaxID=155126 RepID=A0AAN6JYF0_9BASI|nr:Senecionine N-oxygenase [Tilletia horrida]KAK0552999.1 Senecionine N-oxygenase [Tilletia horrida]KAK0566881.1 Senecionine N-oxygenase [Tilletia horrida]
MTKTVGVLALQGAFNEHATHISRIASSSSSSLAPLDVRSVLVRTPAELALCDGLIIPGGESTAIALGAQRSGLMDPLKMWVAQGRPTWGTCAGMIMLSNQAIGTKKGGQSLIGGVDIRVGRNGFGSQVDSFESNLDVPAFGPDPYPGVFIRAPVIDALLLVDPEASKDPIPAVNGAALPVPSALSETSPLPTALPTSQSALAASAIQGLPDSKSSALTIVCAEPPASPILAAAQSDANGGKSVLTSRPPIEILATIPFSPVAPSLPNAANPATTAAPLVTSANSESASKPSQPLHAGTTLANPERRPPHDSQIVALRQGNVMLTSFHPELTSDSRFHEYFVRNIIQVK